MLQVKDDRIRRVDILEIFYNIPSADNMVADRQIIFIGKVVRNTSSDRPEKLC